jgi:anhydro-N-acetylmuramic acid kinase
MSGTSLDAVDFALCACSHRGIELGELWQVPFSLGLRRRLDAAARGEANSWEVSQLHHDLGRFYAACALGHAWKFRPELVGLHGQTIFHNPDRTAPATLQLGEPAYLAAALRVPVVNNFRAADLAAGGQGAPLATLFHSRVFGRRHRHVCVNNLGGISNVTSIDWRRGAQPRVTAFDTGPANMLMDLAVRHFTKGRRAWDADGRMAARGKVCERLLRGWLRHPFFYRRPPKSTGREQFGEPFLRDVLQKAKEHRLSRSDVIATLAALTARSIALNYHLHLRGLPDEVVLAGGGAANKTVVRWIREALQGFSPTVQVRTCDEFGWPLKSIEPAAFAWLAWLRWQGKPGNLPATTGAGRASLLGQITAPGMD